MFVLAACGSETEAAPAPVAPNNAAAEAAPAPEVEADNYTYDDVYQDLRDVHAVVSENLEWGDVLWDQIMLADDVPSPEMKYGLLVVPFFPSDAVLRNTRTVSVSNGNFVVEIVSAETGVTWTINQNGVIARG